MNKSDKLIFGVLLAVVMLLLFSLTAGTFGFFMYKDDKIIRDFVGAGFLTGILVNILFLRKLISRLFDLPEWLLAGVYILGNIFIFGMFMGFPVFNILTGIVAGYYYGRRISIRNIASPQREPLIRNVSLFTALIMALICLSSAYIGLREKTIGEELKGMLRLGFVPGKGLIIAGIIAGGAVLITAQYYITRLTISKTVKYGRSLF
jgi:hypothetical protein